MKEVVYCFTKDFSLDEQNILAPKRHSDLASGFDLASCSHEDIVIEPFERIIVPTGIKVEIAPGFEGQIRSRSGLSLKSGIVVVNSPGTIDADYRGELKIILTNFSKSKFIVTFGMRVAQLVIAPVVYPQMTLSKGLNTQTKRAQSGFGSTGIEAQDHL